MIPRKLQGLGLKTAAELPPRQPLPGSSPGLRQSAGHQAAPLLRETEPRAADPAGPVSAGAGRQEAAVGAQAKIEYVDETPKRARRTNEEIAAEDALGHHWVTLLSIERPAPRYFGDNRGALPLWIEANADWRQSGLIYDRQQHWLRAVRLAVMGVPSAAHAERLKRALEEALTGRETDSAADPLRHRFRNAVDFGDLETWWTPLLVDAVTTCELQARDFETFSRADHDAMVMQRLRQMEQARQRGNR